MRINLKSLRALICPSLAGKVGFPVSRARALEKRRRTGGGYEGRRLRVVGLIGLVGLFGLAALLLGGTGVSAQSSVTLASNFGQTDGNEVGFGHEYGQTFSTHANAGGYKLTALKLEVDVGNNNGVQPTYTIELWSITGNGKPLTKLETLTNPTAIKTGVNTWTFPGGGYDGGGGGYGGGGGGRY